MTKEELIKDIEKYEKYCDESDTWYRSDLVEDALSLLDSVKTFLNEN
jgi:hypothetical protein